MPRNTSPSTPPSSENAAPDAQSSERSAKPRRSRLARLSRGLLGTVLIALFLLAVLWWTRSRLLVPQLKSWVVAQAEEQGYRVQIGPLTLEGNSVLLEDLTVTRGEGRDPSPLVEFTADRVYVDVALWQLATRGLGAVREVRLEIDTLHLQETARDSERPSEPRSDLPATLSLPRTSLELQSLIWERKDGARLALDSTDLELAHEGEHLQLAGGFGLSAGRVTLTGHLAEKTLHLDLECDAVPLCDLAVLWQGEESLAGRTTGRVQLELPLDDPLAFSAEGGPIQVEELSAYGFHSNRVSAMPSWHEGTVRLQALAVDDASGSIRSDDLRLGIFAPPAEDLLEHRLLLRDAGSVFEELEGDFAVESTDLHAWIGEWVSAETLEQLSLSRIEAHGRFMRSAPFSLDSASLTTDRGSAEVRDLGLGPAFEGGAPSWNLDSWRLFELKQGTVEIRVPELHRIHEALAGTASLTASPVGPLGELRGEFSVDAHAGPRPEDLRPLTMAVEIQRSDWNQRALDVRVLEIRSQDETLLQGSGMLPLSNLPLQPDAEPFEAHLSIRELETHLPHGLLPSLLPGAPDLSGPLSGRLAVSSSAEEERQGILELASSALHLHLVDAEGETLVLGPSTLECSANLAGSRVRLSSLSLADTEARFVLTGEGAAPLDSSGGEFDLQAELNIAEIDAFSTPLSALLGFRLPLRAGSVSGNATVSGLHAKPEVNSRITLEEGVLVVGTPLPAATKISSEISLHTGRIEIERLTGELGASPFSVEGHIELPPEAAPRLALRFRGDNLLFVRKRTLRVRADADLELLGPVESLLAKGNLMLRGGRLTAPVEFLDFSRRGAQDPSERALGLQIFSLPSPPLSAMRFDIDVRTAEPFRIENNVAKGGIRPSLKLEGTGQTPLLAGTVFIDPTRVNLPATSLQVQSGRVEFERNNPFFPTLAINGTTRVRGIEIDARVAGRFDDPEIYLSSSPAQPNEDLVYLLLTGTLPESSFRSSSRQAAQSLAVYLAQDFIQRWFGGENSAEDGESFAERIDFQRGQDVSRSGSETLQASFRLQRDLTRKNDTLYLTAEKDVYDHVNFGLRLVFRFE